MVGTSVTCLQGSQALVLCAALEAELHGAHAILRETFRDLSCDAISVAYVEEGSRLKEPYTRVIVQTPDDFYGDVIGDLSRRLGWIEGAEDASIGAKTVTATAPSCELFGYGAFLNQTTGGRGHVEFEFLGYDFVSPRPRPPDPKNPAVAKRA
jgi:translation elongation factor EF-G